MYSYTSFLEQKSPSMSYQAVACDLVTMWSMSVAMASFTHTVIQIPINSSKARNACLKHTKTQSESVKKRKQVGQCVPWIYLTRGSSVSNWTRANFYSWSSLVPINGRVSDLHGEWMKSAHTTQTHINTNEISSISPRNILFYILLCLYLYTALGSVL